MERDEETRAEQSRVESSRARETYLLLLHPLTHSLTYSVARSLIISQEPRTHYVASCCCCYYYYYVSSFRSRVMQCSSRVSCLVTFIAVRSGQFV